MLRIDYFKIVKILSGMLFFLSIQMVASNTDIMVVPGTDLTLHSFRDDKYYHCESFEQGMKESPTETIETISKYDVGDPFAYALPKQVVRVKIPFFLNGADGLYKNPDINATQYLSYDVRPWLDYYRIYHNVPVKDKADFDSPYQSVPEDQAIWIIREGPVGENTVAFEAHKFPGLFMGYQDLRHPLARQLGLRLLPIEDDGIKKWVSYDVKDAFKKIKGRKAFFSFESHNLSDFYLRIETTWWTVQMVCVSFINHELKEYHASFEFEYIHSDGKIYDYPEERINSSEDRPLPITLEGSSLDSTIVRHNIKTQPTHGILTGNPQVEILSYATNYERESYSGTGGKATYTYAPYKHYHGTDSFTYTVTDAKNRESYPVTVKINVTAVNDELVAHDLPRKSDQLQLFAFEGHYLHHDDVAMKVDTLDHASPLIENLLTNNSKWLITTPFAGSDTVSFESLSKPGYFIQVVDNGLKLTTLDSWQAKKNAAFFKRKGLAGDGTVSFESYTHPKQYVRLDPASQSLRLSSIESDEDKAHASFFMTSDTSQAYRLAEDKTLAVTLSGSDAEGKIKRYEIVESPANGSLTGTGANYTYTPNKGFYGEDRFTYKVINKNNEESKPASVKIEVFSDSNKQIALEESNAFGGGALGFFQLIMLLGGGLFYRRKL